MENQRIRQCPVDAAALGHFLEDVLEGVGEIVMGLLDDDLLRLIPSPSQCKV